MPFDEEIFIATRSPIAVAGPETPLDECLYIKGRLYSHPVAVMVPRPATNEEWSSLEPELAA